MKRCGSATPATPAPGQRSDTADGSTRGARINPRSATLHEFWHRTGLGVDAQGVEAGVAADLGGGDQVDAAADELGEEGVPADVGGDVVLQPGGGGDGGEDGGGGAGGQPPAPAGQEQRGDGGGVLPCRPLVQPGGERVTQGLVDG